MTAFAQRPPEKVMRLKRMGSMFPTRLSFLRVLLRNLAHEGAKVERTHWNIDDSGYGEAVYSVPLAEGDVSLFAMTRPLDDSARSDRVIATAWDAAFVLYDGVPDADERARLAANAPLQEAGRFGERDLVLSRANKSVRLFAETVSALRSGRQPDKSMIAQTGYLMRTTAVYGNGKFGISDHTRIAGRPILGGCFMAEMLTVWLIRGFTHDLAEHLGGAKIDEEIKRHLGVGNATGLGMAPYLVSHPHLVHSWFATREEALARVLSLDISADTRAHLMKLAERVSRYLQEWNVDDEQAMDQINDLRTNWPGVVSQLQGEATGADLLNLAKDEAMEELIVSLMIEAHPEIVDDLAAKVATAPATLLDPMMPTSDLRAAIGRDWNWALSTDFSSDAQSARFWYVSEEKLEPRIGARYEEPGAELESPLDIGRRAAALAEDLENWDKSLAEFLLRYPFHRAAVTRVQGLMKYPYGEIRDNMIAETCRPIDMLRSKLAMFGASKFDPKSDLWTRIALAQGAPLRDNLSPETADDWWLAAFS